MKSKKIIALITAVSSIALVLSGCSKSSNGSTNNSSKSAPTEITWYLMGNGMTPDVSKVDEKADEMVKDLNIKLNLQYIPWGDYGNKMKLIISSGQNYDMAFMSAGNGYATYATQGAFVDLTDKFTKNLPNFSKVLDPAFVEAAKVNGKLYALATNKETFGAFGFDVNKKYADQLGIDLSKIKTVADMESALALVKQKLPNVTPLFMEQSYALPFDRTYDQIGDTNTPGVVFADDNSLKVADQFETPEKMSTWQTAYKWMQAGYINKNAATTTDESIWGNGQAFARPQWGLGVLPQYKLSGGDTVQRVYIGNFLQSTSTDTGAMIAFSKTSKNPDKAMAFFDRFATDPQLLNLICFGIEGQHYQITDKSTNPPREDYLSGQNGTTVKYNSGGAWSIGGNYFLSYLGASDPANRNELIQQENKEAKKSPALGFTFDPTSVQNYIASTNNVVAQYAFGLNTGTIDPSKYASEFIKALKAAGSDKIVEAKQQQIDAWKSSK